MIITSGQVVSTAFNFFYLHILNFTFYAHTVLCVLILKVSH